MSGPMTGNEIMSQSGGMTQRGRAVRLACPWLLAARGAVVGLLVACFTVSTADAQKIAASALLQIQALQQEKASWTPVQRKINSKLLLRMKKKLSRPIIAGVPEMRSSVTIDATGNTLVDIKADVSDGLRRRIQDLGGQLINSQARYGAIRALIPVAQLEVLAAETAVKSIRPADELMLHKTNTSQGVVAHRADTARTTYGVDGTGVRVGVISDSVESLASLQATGDLPAGVTVLPGQASSGSSEGTAMLEIVYDIAPGAALYFATANGGQAQFAQNILDLRAAGCNVIVDDVSYFAEPVFQDGIIAQAVDTVTASGAVYFSSAGNSGNLNDGTAGVWEGDFVRMAAPAPLAGAIIHDFGSGMYYNTITVDSLSYFTLQWADPSGASTNDYDLYELNAARTAILDSSTGAQDGTQDPFEYISSVGYNDKDCVLVIVCYSGASRYLHLNANRGRFAITTAGQTWGHSAAESAFSVAAVNVARAGGGVFTGGAADPVESFSSDGPRRIFYTANGTPITPGNFTATGGTLRQKPDIAAADGVSCATPGFNPFYGTSAAAPHGAGIAALMIAHGLTTPAQIRQAITNTAWNIEADGVDRDSGWGLVNALAAVGYSVTGPTVTINQAAGQADPTNASPIAFTVVFSETVADFATGDVTITGTAPGTKTGTVTGAGTTYTVAVSGMTGSGTVIASLAAGVAHDAEGNPNAASTSTDNTVTYDVTAPAFSSIAASPSPATLGTAVTITFAVSEPLAENPTVTVNTHAASYVSRSGTNYTYAYTILSSDADGDAAIAISGTDPAGNPDSGGSTTALDVGTLAAITTQPQSLTNNPGSSASFMVAATGTAPLYYQWQKNTSALVSETNTTYTIGSVVAGDAGSYRCLVSNLVGVVTSEAAVLTVNVPTTPPSAPAGVSASDGAYTDKVQVVWDAVSGATRYEVWRNTANNPGSADHLADVAPGLTSGERESLTLRDAGNQPVLAPRVAASAYDDTSALADVIYYYWVKARNTSGVSGFSPSDSGYCAVGLLPPGSVVASDGTYSDKVRIIWPGVAGATGYEVWRSAVDASGFAAWLGEVSGLEWNDTTARLGVLYYYWVKSKNVLETSIFSLSDSGYRSGATRIQPRVTINGASSDVTLHRGDTLSIAVFLMATSSVKADWWVVVAVPGGAWYYFDAYTGGWAPVGRAFVPTYQGPLCDFLAPLELLNISTYWLPAGTYVFYFGVDTAMNGALDSPPVLVYDSATLTLTE